MATSAVAANCREDVPKVCTRKTRGGRTLEYHLNVLQQPARARACGSGSKSAADRRPVDPPPVVELRILERGANGELKDITFNYNANFFLFATLEVARQMAHGRVQAPTGTPVLTGMPVSGMAYLDRPNEAGYFLFPDLSVRHEGRYKLSFNLYEQAKDPADLDPEQLEPKPSQVGDSFDWRMEVKSKQFQVYSAKKFPGLSESTALSRTVAEQGCRVRIRRDVRMRRREGKGPGGDYNKVEDDYVHHRPTGRSPERQAPHDYRHRSSSAASDHSRHHYQPEPQRRQSGADYPAPPPPPGYNQGPSNNHHLGFGNTTPHLPHPAYIGAQPPAVSPTTGYTSNGPTKPPYQPYPYDNGSSSNGSPRNGHSEHPPSNHYSMPSPHHPSSSFEGGPGYKPERDNWASDRRTSYGYPGTPIAPRQPQTLPSFKNLLNNTQSTADLLPKIEADTAQPCEQPLPSAGTKRPRENDGYDQRLRNGERPSEPAVSREEFRYRDLLSWHDNNGRRQYGQDGPYYHGP